MSWFTIVQVLVWPFAIVPLQSADGVAMYPAGPVSVTVYEPGVTVLFVPGDSAPGKVFPPVAVTPLIFIVKLDAFALPPFALTTCLITIRCAAWSLLVIVQLFVSPSAMVPLHARLVPIVYPAPC